jgi:hypothetical protein
MTDGGADYCFECIGVAAVMIDAFRSAKQVSLNLPPRCRFRFSDENCKPLQI